MEGGVGRMLGQPNINLKKKVISQAESRALPMKDLNSLKMLKELSLIHMQFIDIRNYTLKDDDR